MRRVFSKRSRARRLEEMRLAFERLLLRGLQYRLLLSAAIVLLVALAGGLLVRLFDPSFDNVGESIWWAFLRLTDPGYLGDDVGVVGRTVSTVITVLGFLIFVGLLIAILTQWMDGLIERVESGVRPVKIHDHILVLGWTHRTPDIVLELLRTKGRLTRFLEAHKASKLRVVILAENVDRNLIEELKEELGDFWNDRQILLRGGSPLRLEHLERVSFKNAAAIILPGDAFSKRSPGVADADTLKILLSIARHTRTETRSPPLAVAALYDEKRGAVARSTYGGETETIAADRIVCRFIAQSVRQPGMWSVLSQLLSVDAGNRLYVRTYRQKEARSFADLVRRYKMATPIGVIKPGTRRPLLNPDPALEVSSGDLLVLIARSYAQSAEASSDGDQQTVSEAHDASPVPAGGPRRLLILGWSRKVPALLREFMDDEMEIDVVGLTPLAERETVLAGWPELSTKPFKQIQANFLDVGVLEGLDPSGYDSVAILARARMGKEAHADAATITAYLSLQHLLADADRKPAMLVEVLDKENSFLFDADHDDVIVSPQVISHLLSQVALRRELGAVFSELARVGGPQIVLQPLPGAAHRESATFAELAQLAFGRGELALGIRKASGEVHLNPDRSQRFTTEEGDQLIALVTSREPSS